jgi:CHASE3 domain sensor protein
LYEHDQFSQMKAEPAIDVKFKELIVTGKANPGIVAMSGIKISIRKKILFFSFLILAGNGFMGYSVYESNRKVLDTEQWVRHTETIIFKSNNILLTGKNIQDACRGFVITNDTSFLEPSELSINIFADIGEIRKLTQDNPAQQERIDSLNFYMHRSLYFSFQLVEIRKTQGLQAAIALSSSRSAKFSVDRINQISGAIRHEEENLLKRRKQANEKSVAVFNRLSTIMFSLMVTFTILLLIVAGNYLLQNKEKGMRAAELLIANGELVFQNEEKEKRAAELLIANRELIFQNKEKEERTAELNTTYIQLKKREKYLKEYIGGLEKMMFVVSHKVRQPVAHILGLTNLIDQGRNSQEEQKQSMDYIKQSALALDAFVKELIEMMGAMKLIGEDTTGE